MSQRAHPGLVAGTTALWFAGAILASAQSCSPRSTIAELEQRVASMHRQSDSEAAWRLVGSALCERLDFADAARMAAALPGENSRKALMAVADASAFEPPRRTESPARSAPDAETQDEILSRMKDYVNRIVARLPDFSALRSTSHFEIADAEELKREVTEHEFRTLSHRKLRYQDLGLSATGNGRLLWMGLLSENVSNRAGREVTEAVADRKGEENPVIGMTTNGEFGPMLGLVIRDVSPGNPSWDRWEGAAAVFRYDVPRDRSHFAVAPLGEFSLFGAWAEYPRYHGEIAVDAADGAIDRLTLIADLDPSGPVAEARISVEYAPTVLGGKTYRCPVHAVAISRPQPAARQDESRESTGGQPTYLNDVTFTQYHLLRGDVRILPDNPAPQ